MGGSLATSQRGSEATSARPARRFRVATAKEVAENLPNDYDVPLRCKGFHRATYQDVTTAIGSATAGPDSFDPQSGTTVEWKFGIVCLKTGQVYKAVISDSAATSEYRGNRLGELTCRGAYTWRVLGSSEEAIEGAKYLIRPFIDDVTVDVESLPFQTAAGLCCDRCRDIRGVCDGVEDVLSKACGRHLPGEVVDLVVSFARVEEAHEDSLMVVVRSKTRRALRATHLGCLTAEQAARIAAFCGELEAVPALGRLDPTARTRALDLMRKSSSINK